MSAVLQPEVVSPVAIPRTRKKYSDSFKANALIALDANGGNLLRTSRELDIPLMTLSAWRNGHGLPDEVTEFRNEMREEVADRLDYCRDLIIESLPGKVDGAGLKDSSVALAVLIDKSQLLRGEPTENLAVGAASAFLEMLTSRILQRKQEAARELAASAHDAVEQT